MKNIGRYFVNIIRKNFGILIGLFLLSLALSVSTDSFATITNMTNIIRQVTINLFLSCGMTFVLLLGGIDLSVGSIIAISGCISAGLIVYNELSVGLAIVIGVLAGTLFGAINGLIVSATTIPPFIITLSMMNIGRGIVRLYTDAKSIPVLNESYTFLGTGRIMGLPIQLYFIVIVIIITSFILNRTQFGRHMYATGGNRIAAEYSGIKVKRVEFTAYVISGFLAAIAGILTIGRTFTATMIMGQGAEMDAISACVLGGVSMSGGRGAISGTVIGAILIAVLSNGMNLLGIDSSWQYIIRGLVVILAVYIDYLRTSGFAILGKFKKSKNA